MIEANDPSLKSWVKVEKKSDFPLQNLPFGVFKTDQEKIRVGSRIGNKVIDLNALYLFGYLKNLPFKQADFNTSSLNNLMKKGKRATSDLRNRLSKIFNQENTDLSDNQHHVDQILIHIDNVKMLMPVEIGDYTDFYSSREHATNVGSMFRDPKNALKPNWLWLPVGYHGRASSVIASGQDIHRPKGQIKPDQNSDPIVASSRKLDFELETAFITYDGKPLGESISTSEAEDYIFGMVLFNDWSARDIQTWEYVPLGPFLGKSFASSISPWIVTMDALEPFKVDGPKQDPKVLDYLKYSGEKSYDINLNAFIQPENSEENLICESNFKYMYWNMAQQMAHHTINGCNIRRGDMLASGTISGKTPEAYGSMLELSWNGKKPLKLSDGSERTFIEDNDRIIIRGYAEKNNIRVGFGEVNSKVLPTK